MRNTAGKVRKSDMFDMQKFLESPLQVVSAGLFISDGEWIHPTRVINSYELIFVMQGTLRIAEEGKEYTVEENQALFLCPGVEHRGLVPTQEKISFYWIHFVFPDTAPPVISSPHAAVLSDSNMRILLKQLLHYCNTPEYPPACQAYLLRLAIMEVLLSRDQSNKKGNKLIKEIQEWIRVHYDKPITLEDIEQRFGYNRDYLTRLFKKSCRMGIKKYIDTVKMNKAKAFILSGEYPLKAIPPMLGIDDYNLFLKMFKYHEGITPRQYRETYTNIHTNKR